MEKYRISHPTMNIFFVGFCLLTFWIKCITSSLLQTTIVCGQSEMVIECQRHQVIMVQNAKYGRMQLNLCAKEHYGHIGCEDEVTPVLHARCSGRRECRFQVLEKVFPATTSCPEDLKKYVQVSYKCITVETGSNPKCTSPQAVASPSKGYLSNQIAEETGCGKASAPWVIHTNPGKVIKLAILDYSSGLKWIMNNRTTINPSSQRTPPCRIYAKVRENNKVPTTICAEFQNKNEIYTSLGNKVEVWLVDRKKSDEDHYFMLSYSVYGCVNPKAPKDGSVERSGDSAVFTCKYWDVKWQHVCNGSAWIGENRNCSNAGHAQISNTDDTSMTVLSLPLGVVVIIILGLAVVIGLMVLAAGLYLMKRKGGSPNPGHESSIMLQNHKHPTYDVYAKPAAWDYERAHSQCSTGRCLVHANRVGGEYEYGTVYFGHRDYYQSPDVVQQEKEPLRTENNNPEESCTTLLSTTSTGSGITDQNNKQDMTSSLQRSIISSKRPHSSPENLNGVSSPNMSSNKQRVFLTMPNNTTTNNGGSGGIGGVSTGNATMGAESNDNKNNKKIVGFVDNDSVYNRRGVVMDEGVCDICTGNQRSREILDNTANMNTFKPSLPHL